MLPPRFRLRSGFPCAAAIVLARRQYPTLRALAAFISHFSSLYVRPHALHAASFHIAD